jgi:hypothetical protein
MRTSVVSVRNSTVVGRWVGYFGVALAQLAVGIASWGATGPVTQNALLGWNPSGDPTTAGYYLYYGTSKTNFTTKLDAGTNVNLAVTNLPGGQTYYFVATAYNSADVESTNSNLATFIASTNPQPVIPPVATQFVEVLSNLVVTNNATEPNTVGRAYTYSLDPGAPSGMHINRTNGVLRWVPPWWAAGNSYAATVHVVDNANPPGSNALNVSVQVGHGVLLTFNKAVVSVGGTASATLSLFSSAAVTNVTFTLDAPTNILSNVTLQSLITGVTVKQNPSGAVHSTVAITTTNGTLLQGTNIVAQVNFTVISGQHSSFKSLLSSSVSSVQVDGSAVPTCVGMPGELVLLANQTLVEGNVLTNGQQNLYLYGQLTSNYVVQATSNPASSNSWTTVYSGTFTNMTQLFTSVNSTNRFRFFRAYTH